MAGSFKVSWAPEKSRLEVTVEGQFDLGLMRRYLAAVRAATANAPASGWVMLSDVRNFPRQVPEVQQLSEDLIREVTARGCSKAVLIASKAVIEMQAKGPARSAQRDGTASYVSTREEAEALLANVGV